jgi:hypothetical protein
MGMRCPHCAISFSQFWTGTYQASGSDGNKWIAHLGCPECGKLVIGASTVKPFQNYERLWKPGESGFLLLYPRASSRGPVPPEVTDPYAKYYQEAALVLNDSPMASAALSRRLLQLLLRDKAGVKKGKLEDEIEAALPSLPPYLQDLHDIREIGNFAAHPNKNTNTGEVIDVEEGEAEWLLDILDKLFDFYFVEPERKKQREAALKAKKAAKAPSSSKI